MCAPVKDVLAGSAADDAFRRIARPYFGTLDRAVAANYELELRRVINTHDTLGAMPRPDLANRFGVTCDVLENIMSGRSVAPVHLRHVGGQLGVDWEGLRLPFLLTGKRNRLVEMYLRPVRRMWPRLECGPFPLAQTTPDFLAALGACMKHCCNQDVLGGFAGGRRSFTEMVEGVRRDACVSWEVALASVCWFCGRFLTAVGARLTRTVAWHLEPAGRDRLLASVRRHENTVKYFQEVFKLQQANSADTGDSAVLSRATVRLRELTCEDWTVASLRDHLASLSVGVADLVRGRRGVGWLVSHDAELRPLLTRALGIHAALGGHAV